MSLYKDLLTTLQADLATQSADASALALATSAKASSDSEVAAATVSFSAAVKAAPGGYVVDATTSTVTLYNSVDGLTFTSVVIASITDPLPAPTPPAS